MNICLITWIGFGNYGTSLQSFALHHYLESVGYSVSLLHEFKIIEIPFWKKKIFLPKKSFIKRSIVSLVYRTTKTNRIKNFNKKNYNHLYITNESKYKKVMGQTDVFLTGSDQIWNCYHNFAPFMFLEFVHNKKKVAYASSVGSSRFPEEYEQRVKRDLVDFAYIGVREKSVINYLSALLGRNDIVHVLDPTFLLDATQWRKFCAKTTIDFALPEEYIFCYLIGNNPNYYSQLQELQEKVGINDVVLIPSLENRDISFPYCKIYKEAGPYEFVSILDKAKYICTDSFHACALSINMSKDFTVFKRFDDLSMNSQNNRIYDLLESFGLSKRMNIYETTPIDYDKVRHRLEKYRCLSVQYLMNALDE